ncbi:MAG: bifunctional DNA primase/polymerase [Actinomycetota bacterium]|nr:bifunctional DNA primase/polymerase [Actinomycetota bacterium]
MAELALAYADAGLPVFPLRPGSKVPLTQRGFRDATRDPGTIRAWWRRCPQANIGLPTGSGLVVFDVDTHHGGVVDERWPQTSTVATPNGGVHLYYRSHWAVPSSVARVAKGVDVRADGGYVVAAGSPLPAPGWRRLNDAPPAGLPGWMARLACEPGVSLPGRRAGVALAPRFVPRERVGEGERNSYLASFAGFALRRGVEPGVLADVLIEENRRACRPPLGLDEVEKVAASISRRHVATKASPPYRSWRPGDTAIRAGQKGALR